MSDVAQHEPGHVCTHGQLARSCEICFLESEVRRYRQEAMTAWQRGFQEGLNSNRRIADQAARALEAEREAHAQTNRSMTEALLGMERRVQQDEALLRRVLEALSGQGGVPVDDEAVPALLRNDDIINSIRNRLGGSA